MAMRSGHLGSPTTTQTSAKRLCGTMAEEKMQTTYLDEVYNDLETHKIFFGVQHSLAGGPISSRIVR